MKTRIFLIITFITFNVLLLLPTVVFSQGVAINTSGNASNTKALLDIDVTGMNPKAGLLIPRLTTAERDAITAPIPESLLIYNTTTQCFEAWNQSTLAWISFGCIGCQLPSTFLASAASGIAATSFDANWTASGGATAYFLDVATDAAFTAFVTGYNNVLVGNVLTANVTGLTCATTYYYRIRANNACGTNANSNTIMVTTSAATTGTSTFTTSGTFTVPVCVTSICVQVWGGGGGGGGGCRATGGCPGSKGSGGGGGGGYGQQCFVVIPGTVYTITVGIGGSFGNLGVSVNGSAGGVGGTSSVGLLISATGGAGGEGGTTTGGGAGGVGGTSTATTNATGGTGVSGSGATGGNGGNGGNGGVGGVTNSTCSVTGTIGSSPGGGGAGDLQDEGTFGGRGEVIITW